MMHQGAGVHYVAITGQGAHHIDGIRMNCILHSRTATLVLVCTDRSNITTNRQLLLIIIIIYH